MFTADDGNNDDDDVKLFRPIALPILRHSQTMPLIGGHRSPKIKIKIEGHEVPILLDTGTEL